MSAESSRTLLGHFLDRVRTSPSRDALRCVQGEKIISTSWSSWERRSRIWASALVALGLEPGDRVAIFVPGRPEWCWFDIAVLMAGGITVPGFRNEPSERCLDAIRHSGARIVLVENPASVRGLVGQVDDLSGIEHLIVLEPESLSDGGELVRLSDVQGDMPEGLVIGMDAFQDSGETTMERHAGEINRRIAALRSDVPATIAYTPGTEGRSKGVVLTHANLVAAAQAVCGTLPLDEDDVQLLYLPLAHVFGRLCVWTSVVSGGTLAFARSYSTFAEDARQIRPTFFCSVPHLLEKLYTEFTREEAGQGDLQRMVSSWARGGAEGGFLSGLRRKVADTLVYGRLRERFGGRLRFVVSGAAPLQAQIGAFLHELGLEVLEGYGLAETAGVASLNRLDTNRFGTVGTPVEGVETALEEDGELRLRGKNVTPGYWQSDATVLSATDPDGWFRTGDLCRVDDDGYLTVVDRKRNIILTATGKVIPPAPISEALRVDPLIDQVVICGDGRPFITALISVDQDALLQFGADSGIEGAPEALLRHEVVYAAIDRRIATVNATLAPHERVQKFAILSSQPSISEGVLTATGRVRREALLAQHGALLDSFYSEEY